jgi:hypothetical protein
MWTLHVHGLPVLGIGIGHPIAITSTFEFSELNVLLKFFVFLLCLELFGSDHPLMHLLDRPTPPARGIPTDIFPFIDFAI